MKSRRAETVTVAQPIDEIFSVIVNRAAKASKLPEVRGVFDGNGWIWAWRYYPTKEEVGETLVRVRPDVDAEAKGIEIEISAGAWMPKERQVSVGRIYYTRYLELEPLQQKKEEDLTSELIVNLSKAWEGAQLACTRLAGIKRRREDVAKTLRSKGLLKS